LIATETIAAISTPPGEGAIALVRISGPAAVQIAEKIFRARKRPYGSLLIFNTSATSSLNQAA